MKALAGDIIIFLAQTHYRVLCLMASAVSENHLSM